MFESIEWPLLAEGDSDMMAAVIRNLLSNSIRATSDGKRISVYLYRSAKNVEVSIVDEGCGMNPELLSSMRMEIGKSIFGKNVKSEFRSYGIGLVIVKQFVALHGGELSIDSELGVGTTVSFYVPLR